MATLHSVNELCLACSSSLPPRSTNTQHFEGAGQSSTLARPEDSGEGAVLFTKCCNKPICPTCLSRNPRLARYNPCLHCLGGVNIVNSSHAHATTHNPRIPRECLNIDGGVKDGDVFTLGDEEDEDPEVESFDTSGSSTPATIQHKSSPTVNTANNTNLILPRRESQDHELASSHDLQDASLASPSTPTPPKYYIQPGDTLLGIALKYKIDVSPFILVCSSGKVAYRSVATGTCIMSPEWPSTEHVADHASIASYPYRAHFAAPCHSCTVSPSRCGG